MSALPLLDDGVLRFTLRSEGGDETSHAIDSMIATVIADELVRKHRLAVLNDQYAFTEAFMDDLAAAFVRRFRLPPVSGSVALRMWHAAQIETHSLKKNTSAPPASPEPTESTPSS